MAIKFLKISSGYQRHIAVFNKKHPEMVNDDYETIQHKFFGDCFSWADFWKKNLEKCGGFEANEIVFNHELMQKKWADENGFIFNENNWMQEILMEQVNHFSPDVIFITDIYHYASWYIDIKKKISSIKLVIGWDGILWHDEETFDGCDLVLTCVEDTVKFYTTKGKKSHFFPFGFESAIVDKLHDLPEKFDVTFIGSVILIKGYHYQRMEILYKLSKEFPVSYWIGNMTAGWQFLSRPQINRLLDGKLPELLKVHRLGSINKGELYGLEMFNAFHNSKFVINTHGDNSVGKAANFRLTEATGAGACMVTDWKENISDYFIPGKEIVTYRSVAEATEKIRFLSENENERKKIADAGHKRTLEQYSFEKRVRDFIPFLHSLLN